MFHITLLPIISILVTLIIVSHFILPIICKRLLVPSFKDLLLIVHYSQLKLQVENTLNPPFKSNLIALWTAVKLADADITPYEFHVKLMNRERKDLLKIMWNNSETSKLDNSLLANIF